MHAANRGDCDAAHASLHAAVTMAAANVMRYRCPKQQPPHQQHKPWFDADCRQSRRRMRADIRHDPAHKKDYEREYHQFTRRKRRQYHKQWLSDLTKSAKHNLHKLFAAAKPPTDPLPEQLQTPAAWEPLFAPLAQPQATTDPTAVPPSSAKAPAQATLQFNVPITPQEVKQALVKLHNHRAGALLGYSSEFLRYAVPMPEADNPKPDHVLLPCLTAIFNAAFTTGAMPESWQTSLVTPIYKRGSATSPNSYRPIAVGEPLARLYASVLNARLVTITENNKLRSPTQAGFRPRLSTAHQLFTLQHIIDKQLHNGQPLYCCFVDLKSAYDKVQRPNLWQTLRQLGITGNMLAAVQSLYSGSKMAIKINGQAGPSINTTVGLRQGCPLSPTLFGLYVDSLHDWLQREVPDAGVQVLRVRASDASYADDIALLATISAQLQQLIDALRRYCDLLGMQVSVEKTKVVVFQSSTRAVQRPPETMQWHCGNDAIEQVSQVKYLGLWLHQDGKLQHTVRRIKPKVAGAWAVVQRKHRQLDCGDTVNLKLVLHRNISQATLMYGSELWGLHDASATIARGQLETMYHKQLRAICGVRNNTDSSALLWELGLQPLKALWWRQTLRFWNSIAEGDPDSFHYHILLDNLRDAMRHKVHNFTWSLYRAIEAIGMVVPTACESIPVLDGDAIMETLLNHKCAQPPAWMVADNPRTCAPQGVKRCVYYNWFMRPPHVQFNKSYVALPFCGNSMRRILRFRLGSHNLPVEKGRMATNANRLDRGLRVCHKCTCATVCDERHVLFECTAVQGLRIKYAHLFTQHTLSVHAFVWQPDQWAVTKCLLELIHYFDA